MTLIQVVIAAGREHLEFYGRLKGIPNSLLKIEVDEALQSVGLLQGGVGSRKVKTYSGGMKRRLSVAIAFIGDPHVIYLDEPSTVGRIAPASPPFIDFSCVVSAPAVVQNSTFPSIFLSTRQR